MGKKSVVFIVLILILAIILSINIFKNPNIEVTNFEECVKAGNPVMESYPRQCRHGGKTFVEEIELNERARTFCGNKDIIKVEVCEEYIKIISSLLGGGSTFYKDGITEIRCPVVGPDSMTEECKRLLFDEGLKCTNVCGGEKIKPQ